MAWLAVLVAYVLTPLYASVAAAREAPASTALSVASTAYNGRCSQWADAALDAGWHEDQLPELLGVIAWCESRCRPEAHNRSGASGLLQIMPMWANGRDLFDPATNLAVGLEVYELQGWHAWQCA